MKNAYKIAEQRSIRGQTPPPSLVRGEGVGGCGHGEAGWSLARPRTIDNKATTTN